MTRVQANVARWVSMIIVLGLLGCHEPAPAQGVVTDSAGVQIVENRAPLWGVGEGWRLPESPSVRIGAADSGDAAVLFTRIDAVRRLSDGRIVVLEDETGELRWFDRSGRHLFTRGGKGGGPGEFEATIDFIVLPGDSILVWAAPRIRYVMFTADGDYVGETAVDQRKFSSLARWTSCLRLLLPDRSLVGCRHEDGLRAFEDAPGYQRGMSRYVLTAPSLDQVTPLGLHGGLEQWGYNFGGKIDFVAHPFHTWSVAAAGGTPTRIAIGLNPQYSIEIWTPEGRLERIIRRRNARHAPSADEKRYALTSMREHIRNEQFFNRVVAAMQVPDSVPAMMELRMSPSGHLWVSRASLDRTKPWFWDVFDKQGVFLGSVEVPGGFIMYEAGDDYVLGLYTDENDVPYVELYPILKGVSQ